MWQHWISGILGLWVIVIPFLGLTDATLTWALALTGIIIAVLGFWSGAVGSQA